MENGNSYPGIRIDKLDSDTVVRFIDQGNDAVVISGTLNMGSHRIVKGADPIDGKDFATKDYVDQISGLVEGSDVDSVNSLIGNLTFVGDNGISVSDNTTDTITITGPDLSSFSTISELISVSGTLQSQIDGLTFDVSAIQQSVSDLQTDFSSLSSELVTVSGYLQSQINAIDVNEADVSSLNSLQGDLIIQGAGSVSVSTDGSNIVVSGTSSGGSSGVWENVATSTLSSDTQSISLSGFAEYDYLKVFILLVQGDDTGSTNEEIRMTFNGDTGSNYFYHIRESGALGGSAQPYAKIVDHDINSISIVRHWLILDIFNDASSIKHYTGTSSKGADTFNHPPYNGLSGYWNNTSTKITTITITSDPTNSKLKAGTKVKIIGMNF